MGSLYDPAYDGKGKRWRVQCGFECAGERCRVMGECARNPEGPKAREFGIYCPRHAREDGRTKTGRNKDLRHYIMTVSKDDKKRLREDQKYVDKAPKKKRNSPAVKRKASVYEWLGSRSFKECSVFDRNMILGELRVPPLLLGDSKRPTRVYLMNDFSLDNLKYLFEKRADGRKLFFVRGNSIIRLHRLTCRPCMVHLAEMLARSSKVASASPINWTRS